MLVVSAVGYQWFYNGANFVAFKIGGDAVHPLYLAAMRFTISAAMVLPLVLWRLRSRPARTSELAAAAGLGLVMLVGGQSLGMFGTHLLPAGVASVFGSSAPIFIALSAWAVLRQPLGLKQAYGVGLGFAGLPLRLTFRRDPPLRRSSAGLLPMRRLIMMRSLPSCADKSMPSRLTFAN